MRLKSGLRLVTHGSVTAVLVLAGLPTMAHAVPVSASSLSVTLAASATNVPVGTTVTFTATSSQDVASVGYRFEIFDKTRAYQLTACTSGTTCSVTDARSFYSEDQFVAYISSTSGDVTPPPGTVATSNVVTVTWGATAGDECNVGQSVIIDGFVGGEYLRLRTLTSGSETIVCYRFHDDTTGGFIGGAITIAPAVPQVGMPSIDTNYQACASAGGNLAPGPHPLVNGTVLGSPLTIDTYANSNAAWVCAAVGTIQARIVVPVSASDIPSVSSELDPTSTGIPVPSQGPTAYPSGTCPVYAAVNPLGYGGNSITPLDADIMGAQTVLSVWQPDGRHVDVCGRIDTGTQAGGGLLNVSAPTVPSGVGLQPVIGDTAGLSPACTDQIAQFTEPTDALLATSNQDNPLVLCIGVGGVTESVTVGVTGSPSVPVEPVPTFSPDPDSV
jgi:hypothetical protein